VQVERSAFRANRLQLRSVDLRPRRHFRSIGALLVATAGLVGCQTAQDAATATATAVQATGAAVSAAVMPEPTQGAALLRTQMEERAGPAHFRNSQLVTGKEGLQATHTPFEASKAKFVSSVFVSSREKFRGGKSLPAQGPVLGAAVGDSAATLAALAAAQAGVPLPLAQPFLAHLLPGWGY